MSARNVNNYSRRAVAALILSPDPLAAALMAASLELSGFRVDFAQMDEAVGDALRRVKPRVVLLDCRDERARDDRLVGPAIMMGAWLFLFGTREGLRDLHVFASRHSAEMVVLPDDAARLPEMLARAKHSKREQSAS